MIPTEKKKKKVTDGDIPDSLEHATAAGAKHESTRFGEQAPQLFWWKHLGKNYFIQVLKDFLNDESTAIEFGSGAGRVEDFLVEMGMDPTNIIGLEINGSQVEQAREAVPGATFIQADIASEQLLEEHDQLQPNMTDLAVSSMVVEWLNPEQLRLMCQNAFKIVEPGGTFFIMTTHPSKSGMDSGLDTAGSYQVRLPWTNDEGEHETGLNYHRDKEEFEEALVAAGFPAESIIFEDLQISEEAEADNPEEYARYTKYPYSRLAIKATKPE